MKIVYYNCEITEQAVGENQNSCVLAAETSNAYAQRVAQMEQDSFDDAWTEAMVADSLAQSHNHLWIARIDAVHGLLEVRHGNGAAKHLYEKNGYHLLACRKNYYKHPDEDADIYEIAFIENGE